MEKIYKGYLKLGSNGEEEDILFLVEDNEDADPLAEIIKDDIDDYGSFLTVSYFISDKEMSIEELDENLIKKISGSSDVEYVMAYSEYTGYLWTDEEINVGGHDLLEELKSYAGGEVYELGKGKITQPTHYCYLKIVYSKSDEQSAMHSREKIYITN